MVSSNVSFSWEINQKNVVDVLHRAGGSLERRLVMGQFLAGIKDERLANPKSLNRLSTILNSVALPSKDVRNNPTWRLKKEFF